MERALLVATSQGVSTGVMNQAVQMDGARQRMRRLLRIEQWPVAMLRFGFGPETPPTPRRPLADCLVRAASGARSAADGA
jgi:hypothetical protein